MHKNLVKFGCVVFKFCGQTDGQSVRHTYHSTSHTSWGEVISTFLITTTIIIGSHLLVFLQIFL